MLRADKAEVQTVPDAASIVPTTNKQFHKAARLESERWFAEPQEAHGDICHASGGLAGHGDLPKDGDVMRLKSRFHGVGQVASEWRRKAFRVRLGCQFLLHLGFEEAQFSI